MAKKYVISHSGFRSRSLRETLGQKIWDGLRWFGQPLAVSKPSDLEEEFWALRDVSFEVEKGNCLGIIGRNGAGKSTLLKILSRVTEPTAGRVGIKGRVASLLEVGTGFHAELTGRENIFLNGTILGMTQGEIRRNFDDIVAFAGIEKFLDTPVKRYSSGMYVRLAFAVAAHLESEILIVDEVLAVGDSEFQKKCMERMDSVTTRQGRTILFVSHSMAAIRSLCKRAILLDQGVVKLEGPTDQVIQEYLNVGEPLCQRVFLGSAPRHPLSEQKAIREAWIEDESGNFISTFPMGSSIKICFRFLADRDLFDFSVGFQITNSFGNVVLSFPSYMVTKKRFENRIGGVAKFYLPRFPLLPGKYSVSLGISERPFKVIDSIPAAFTFVVESYDLFETGIPFENAHGVFFANGDVEIHD